MTTTTTFTSLSVPAPDDTMEMSSPANRNLDDDIDIDFDDYQAGGVQLTDDERMIEDETRPATATDDLMDDGFLPREQGQVEEEVMHVEELQPEEDEELIDYGEDDFHEDAVILEATDGLTEPTETVDAVVAHVDEEILPVPDDTIVEAPGEAAIEEVQGEEEQILEPSAGVEEIAAHAAFDEVESDEANATAAGEPGVYEAAKNAATAQDRPSAGADEAGAQANMSLNTSLSVTNDTPGTPTDTGLHPMNVRYGDLHMPLFKSRRQPDGLLKDDNLANLSLAELMQNCRQRLALKIGDDISSDQELVLSFEHLGLMLVEDSRAAFESSLNDVLEVYMQLHRNDGNLDAPPLSLSLSLQLKFASSFSILKQAAAGGQGISSFSFLRPAEQGQEDYYDEEGYDEDGGQENAAEPDAEQNDQDEFEGHEYDESTYVEHDGDDAAQLVPAEESLAHDEGADGYEGDQQDYYQEQEEHYEDTAADVSTGGEHNEAAELLELHQGEADDQEQPADSIYNAPEAPDNFEEEDETQHRAPTEGGGAVDQAHSTASSATVQGDDSANADTTTGEYYDDELIEWDSESLTGHSSSEHALVDNHAGHDEEFETFLTEYDGDETQEASKDHTGVDAGTSLPLDAPSDAQNLASEDFLNDFGEQQAEHDTAAGQPGDDAEAEYDEAGEQLEIHEGQEDEYDQADTYDEQQEDQYTHPDYQPGEQDEEQFHTAHDFLNDGGEGVYEHGLEHDPVAAGGDQVEDFEENLYPAGDGDGEYDQENFGDELGFNDDDDGTVPHQTAGTGSPLGKRSFDEVDEVGDDQPELKKARAS